jgi:hypothetical protein
VHCSASGNFDDENELSTSTSNFFALFKEDAEINKIIYKKNNFSFVGKVYSVAINRLTYYLKENGIIKK